MPRPIPRVITYRKLGVNALFPELSVVFCGGFVSQLLRSGRLFYKHLRCFHIFSSDFVFFCLLYSVFYIPDSLLMKHLTIFFIHKGT